MYYLILKNGEYAEGDFKPEGSAEVSRRPPRLETTWDGSTWVETDDSKAQEYARNRATEYPALAEQLDEIYHNGIDSWKAVIKVTKDKYPKG